MIKKLFLISLLSYTICIPTIAYEMPKAYYVYQKEGGIHAFFYDEVDSIVYSKIDIDSIICDMIVIQEIWTSDTVFRIPIESIDSIGFQTPPTIYKEGVKVLNKELLSYINAVDSNTIYFDKSTPSNNRPKKDDKLIFTSMTSLFPNGFSGTVLSTRFSDDAYIVECLETPIEDMVEQYYAVRSFYAYDSDGTMNARRAIGVDWYYDNTIKFGDWKYDIDLAAIQTSINFFNFGKEHLKDYERVNFSKASYSLNGSAEKLRFYGCVRPSLRINSCFIINKELGKTFILSVNGKWNHQHSMDLKGALDLSIDIPFKPLTNAWNLGAAYKVPLGDGFFIYFKPGLSVGAEGSLEYEQSDESETNIYFFYRYDEHYKQNQIPPQLVLKSTKKSIAPTKISGSLKGHCGFFLEVGLTFIDEIFAKLGWRGEAGVSIEYDATLSKNDFSQKGWSTINYEKLVDNAVVWKGYRSGAIDLKFAWFPFSISLGKTEKEWERKSFVPTFSNLSLGKDSETKRQLTTEISGNIFGSLLVGTRIFDEDSETSMIKYFDKEFDRTSPFNKYTIDFSDYLKPNHKYTAYPVVKWNDSNLYLSEQELLAIPKIEFSKSLTPITDYADEIETNKATLHGYIEGDIDFINKDSFYGMIIGTDANPTKNGTTWEATQNNKNFYEIPIHKLEEGTTYYYCAFLCVDGEYTYGEIKSFKTLEISVEIEQLTLNKASYYPNHYTFNGNEYSFRYNCTVTLQMKGNNNIEDWGYIYEDSHGYKTRISCKDILNIKQDSRYFYRNEDNPLIKLFGFVKYYNKEELHYGKAKEIPISYPIGSSITMTNCEFKGTEPDVDYQGKTYKYKSTFRFLFTVSGAYWLKVKTKEEGEGWNGWNNLPDRVMSPVDGANALTVNYYYNEQNFDGDFHVYLYGNDETHTLTYKTDGHATLSYSNGQFSGCSYHPIIDNAKGFGISRTKKDDVYEVVIDKCF
ncbi:MAG: hypothetical protein IKI83_05415 [Prevotella sp.]|nr:hypothetical protein [Prevotella sp.]